MTREKIIIIINIINNNKKLGQVVVLTSHIFGDNLFE